MGSWIMAHGNRRRRKGDGNRTGKSAREDTGFALPGAEIEKIWQQVNNLPLRMKSWVRQNQAQTICPQWPPKNIVRLQVLNQFDPQIPVLIRSTIVQNDHQTLRGFWTLL